jgi:Tfp pilus assembly protein PilF
LAELIRNEARLVPQREQIADELDWSAIADSDLADDANVEEAKSLAPVPPLTFRELIKLPEQAELYAPVQSRPENESVRSVESATEGITSAATDLWEAGIDEQVEGLARSPDSAAVVIAEPSNDGIADSKNSSLRFTETFDEESRFARMRNAAASQGFGMLALDCLEPPAVQVESVEADEVEPSVTATIHETRQRELARVSLQTAVHRLSRGATHSAKRSTIEALTRIVAMLDARGGPNSHAKHLATALDAIRESSDFAGTYGVVDQDSLVRMVAVHKTTVLKNQSLEKISSLQAIEEYLQVAHENLVAACESIVEASDALVLMGKIQLQMNERTDTQAAAVALTYHRAAVSVDPHNAIAHRELGKTLYGQGWIEQAAWSFSRSVELQPTIEHYRLLMQVAQKMGDMETVSQCETAINDPRLAAPLPIRHLDAKSFAATYKPTSNDYSFNESLDEAMSNQAVSARKTDTHSSASEERPKSNLSQFKSWLPKFRRE